MMMMSDEDNNNPGGRVPGGSSERGGRLLRLKNNYSVGPAETLSMGQEDRFVLLPPVPVPLTSKVRSGGGPGTAPKYNGAQEIESGSGG